MTVPVILRFFISPILKTVIIQNPEYLYYLDKNIILTLYPLISTGKSTLNKNFLPLTISYVGNYMYTWTENWRTAKQFASKQAKLIF